MHFFRVEMNTPAPALGPYQAMSVNDDDLYHDVFIKLFEFHTNGTHPTPEEDPGLRFIQKMEYCGFSSMEKLRDWFNEKMRAILMNADFVIRQYEIPSEFVRRGVYQDLAIITKAISVKTFEIEP